MCHDCAARQKMARDALMKARLGEAMGHVVKGVAEITGVKKKTGVKEKFSKLLHKGDK